MQLSFDRIRKSTDMWWFLCDICSNTVTATVALHAVRTHQTVLPPIWGFAVLPASYPAIWRRKPRMNCRDVRLDVCGALGRWPWFWCIPVIGATSIITDALVMFLNTNKIWKKLGGGGENDEDFCPPNFLNVAFIATLKQLSLSMRLTERTLSISSKISLKV